MISKTSQISNGMKKIYFLFLFSLVSIFFSFFLGAEIALASITCEKAPWPHLTGCGLLKSSDLNRDGNIDKNEIKFVENYYGPASKEFIFIYLLGEAYPINYKCSGCFEGIAAPLPEPPVTEKITCESGLTPTSPTGCDLLLQYDANQDGTISVGELETAKNAPGILSDECYFVRCFYGVKYEINEYCPGCFGVAPTAPGAPGAPGVPRTNCPGPTEGLVPCGTEGCPCEFCDFFVMTNRIIQFVMTTLVPVIAVLMLVIGGVMFFFAGAKPDILIRAKGIITSVFIGLLIIFSAWIIVNTILVKADIVKKEIGGKPWTWWQIECPVNGGAPGVTPTPTAPTLPKKETALEEKSMPPLPPTPPAFPGS